MWFHTSPSGNLEVEGILHSKKPTVGRFHSTYVYLGTWDYILNQYFKYCPKGRYYIYQVNIPEEYLEKDFPAAKSGQARVNGNIPPSMVHLVKTIEIGKGYSKKERN